MSTTAVETLESLQEALDPLDAIQSEQVELGSWIHDSFSALEKLHEELTQWQSELARKETDLDLREDALNKPAGTNKASNKQTARLEQQLAKTQEGLKRVGAKNDELLSQYGAALERTVELETALAAEREQAASDRELWKEQFEFLRGDLEKYYQLLAEQLEKVAAQQGCHELYTPLSAGAAHAKSVELRRRAQSRREAKGRN
jgi:chromosome segregation ATPase